jgi:undecaprenyl diphosphate synthase
MTLPNHVAIIMDGNGRWANKRNLPRVAGHKVGLESVRAVVRRCVEKKVPVLTLFAFSTENWDRPKEEVSFLMEQLFVKTFDEEVEKLHENGIKLRVIGEIARLDKKLQGKIVAAEKKTANNSGLKLIIALSYSGRWDIVNAAKQICQQIENGKLRAKDVTDEEFSKHICLHDLPEPDLLIRTSGEQRISNFMLWQLAYTELYFTDVLWPDFREKELDDALLAYTTRNRRFGKC